MANSKIGIIITREFNERVRKKSFIVTTILMPVLMIGLMVAPALIMRYSQGETRHISVIDESGVIAPRLESSEEVVYEPTDLTLDEARREHTDRFGILWIGGDIMTNPGNVKLYTNGSSAMLVEESVSGQIADIIEKEKLKDYNIENLSQILDDVWIRGDAVEARTLRRLLALYREGVGFEISEIDTCFERDDEKNLIYKICSEEKSSIENPVKYANDCVRKVYKNFYADEIESLNKRLVRAQATDSEESMALLKELSRLRRESKKPPSEIEEF